MVSPLIKFVMVAGLVFGVIAAGLFGTLSIFGPSAPTRTDIFLIDGISGNYWTNERGLGIIDKTGVLNQLMDAPVYDTDELMAARAGLIVSNPRLLGFCGYQLNSARYAWVVLDADGTVIFPGRSLDVAPADWPRQFLPLNFDPQNRLIFDFGLDSWTGNGKDGVSFIAFSLLVGYSTRAGCNDPWEPKLEIFAADGADIIGAPVPPPPPPPDYVGPGTPSLSFTHDGSHAKPWAGDTVTLNYRSEPGTEPIQHYVVTWDAAGCTCVQEFHDFVVGSNEDIAVKVIAFDGTGLSSPAEMVIDVGFEGETEGGLDLFMLLEYIVIGVVALFILFVVLWFLPIPTAFKVMIIVVAIVILLAVVLPKFISP